MGKMSLQAEFIWWVEDAISVKGAFICQVIGWSNFLSPLFYSTYISFGFSVLTVCDAWTYGLNCRNSCLCKQNQTERWVILAILVILWNYQAVAIGSS